MADLNAAWAVIQAGVHQGAFPGAVAAVGTRDGLVALEAFGHASLEPYPEPMATDTLFDLASLTKVVATTPAVLRLVEEGRLDLDQPVCTLLPQCQHSQITIRHLLTHTSGLPAWRPLYLQHQGSAAYVAAIGATPLVRPPARRWNTATWDLSC